jgi:hypothetical protein
LLERLSDRDLEFLAPGRGDILRRNPEFLLAALDAPAVFERLSGDPDALLHVSPYLLFSVFLRRALRELREARFTLEAAGARRRVPVFDAAQVRALLSDPTVRDYLADVLASFTRVYSGSTWRRTPRGWRRHRFSELDVASLQELEAQVSETERFHLDRRIGDVALLLTGVFPDALAVPRLRQPSLEELEQTGARRYGRAAQHPLAYRSGDAAVLARLAERFHLARKALNFLTDRYLYPFRANWFPAA